MINIEEAITIETLCNHKEPELEISKMNKLIL